MPENNELETIFQNLINAMMRWSPVASQILQNERYELERIKGLLLDQNFQVPYNRFVTMVTQLIQIASDPALTTDTKGRIPEVTELIVVDF